MLLPLVVGGGAWTVLLIAAANVTNLLMLRVAARRRELAVRRALGAGLWAVGRLLVIESLVLATLFGGAALGLAAVASRVLRSTLLPEHRWAGSPLDATAIAFTGVAALVVGLATAAAPADRRSQPIIGRADEPQSVARPPNGSSPSGERS